MLSIPITIGNPNLVPNNQCSDKKLFHKNLQGG
jgi:hypothetical protein